MLNFKRLTMLMMILSVFSISQLSAQNDNVGIGTTTPHPATILDVNNEDGQLSGNPSKGIRLPFANTVLRNQMYSDYNGNLPNGLMVFDTDLGKFMYYKWDTPTQTPPVTGQWVELTIGTQNSNSNVPQGGIIMWSGTIASIPAGWALCNGANGTPDLTDKFVLSVASVAENPGTAAVPGFYVNVDAGTTVAPDRRFFKLAYIMKL